MSLIISVAIPILAFIAVVWLFNQKGERPVWLQAFAKAINFSFLEVANNAFINNLQAFTPFAPNLVTWRFRNMLVGTIDRVSVEIFDFSSTVDLRLFLQEHKKTRTQTFIHLTSNKLYLPHFALRPKTTQDRNHHRLRKSFFRIKGNQEFFQNYIVQTDDEAAVRVLFDAEVCSHFARLLTKSVEGRGNQLLYYYEGHLISHERIDEFLEEAIKIFNLFATKSKIQSVLKESYGHVTTGDEEING